MLIRVHGLGEFIETLKVLDSQRAVGGYRLLSMSCSGGEAAMIGDAAVSVGLNFPRLDNARKSDLKKVLGKQLSFSNPLDYHTAIWDDEDAMFAMVAAVLQVPAEPTGDTESANEQSELLADSAVLVLDYPRQDQCGATGWFARWFAGDSQCGLAESGCTVPRKCTGLVGPAAKEPIDSLHGCSMRVPPNAG